MFSESGVKSFLEIGIGRSPNVERLLAMQRGEVAYVGCDFDAVCQAHQRELEARGVDRRGIRFTGNPQGSYSWPLFEMMSRGETYDAIYLDGHHTFYVDLPAAMLAHELLRPGGYLVLDDIRWTLGFLKGSLKTYFHEWRFYRGVYDFSQYSQEQQNKGHIGMISEEFLMRRLGYRRRDELSCTDWWVLQKPL